MALVDAVGECGGGCYAETGLIRASVIGDHRVAVRRVIKRAPCLVGKGCFCEGFAVDLGPHSHVGALLARCQPVDVITLELILDSLAGLGGMHGGAEHFESAFFS